MASRKIHPSSKEANQLTREAIQGALIKLMKKKEFDDISITELAQKAGVSRTAYYNNYYEKEDVLKDLFSGLIEDLNTAYSYCGGTENFTRTVAAWARRNCELLLMLSKAHFEELLLDELIRITTSTFDDLHAPERLQVVVYSGAIFALIREWIVNGMVETEEEIVQIFHRSTK